MKDLIKSYTEIIFEDVLLEGKHEAFSKWKDYDDVEEYIEKFMNKQNGIRLKIGKPYNNIDYSNNPIVDFDNFPKVDGITFSE